MKKVLSLLLLCSSLGSTFAQESGSDVIVASGFSITRPLRDIFAENPVDENKVYQKHESDDRMNRHPQKFRFSPADGPEYGNEPRSIQERMGDVRDGLEQKVSWTGQTASGFRPFDPSGAAGPNHYVQMINSTTFKVYNKTSGAVLLTGTLGNLWSPATANAGDPVVMYDKPADRWFLAQFGSSTDKKIYIAISTTNDPTGSYYTYTFTSPQFPDYLKFSVWQDGYYMTSNQSTQKVFCFERTAMLAGTPGARSIYVNYSPPKSGFFVPLTGDAADGVLPPAGTPCPIFSYSDNGWGSGYFDRVNIYQMTVNWSAAPTASISLSSNLTTAAFDGSYNASWNDCPQPGTTQKLDGIGGCLMYRAQWKTWSGYNSVVLNWAVKISSTQRSIKWCELRQNQSTGVWSLYQEGIYAPDADTRWLGSICMDNNGSIGLTYIKSNSTATYPGIYYTGRRSCDPLGTLPVTEAVGAAGTGSQTGVNRVGDYGQTTLDPDGITFWSTSEYMGGTTGSSAARTRIISYQITPCGLAAGVAIAVTGGSNPSCAGQTITLTATPTNGGASPSYQWKVNGTNVGTNSSTYSSSALANGDVVTCVMTSNLSGVTGNPAASNAITITISSAATPGITIAQTTGSNPTCAGASVTFTATPTNGGSAPTYQWKVNGANVGTNSATYTTTALTNGQVVSCVMTSNLPCASVTTATSNSITITVNPSVVPAVAIAITAGSNPSNAGASVTFTATPTNGGAAPSYQWKVNGTNAGTNSPTFTTTTLTNGQIVTCVMTSNATCAVPASATSNAITMTINGGVTYCTAGTTSTTYERITNVTMGSINNTSAASSYSNYTALSTNVSVGVATSITVTIGVPYSTDKVYIWCDWNRNGTLTDAGEAVYASAAGVGPFSTSITPPTGTSAGAVRMRIRLTDSGAGPNTTPCGNSSYGEVEDYTLNVVNGLSPQPVEQGQTATVSNLRMETLDVYPNPTNGACTIKASSPGTYYVLNELGDLVRSFTLNNDNQNAIQLNDMPAGTYIISGQTRTGIVKQKLIVTR